MDLSEKRIILVEGKQTDHPSFFFSLQRKGYNVEIAKNGAAAIDRMKCIEPVLTIIDAASLRTSGKRIIYSIKKRNPDMPIIMIVDDTFEDRDISSRADLVMTLPFTIQKLVNRIDVFLHDFSPEIITAGNISLDIENQVVSVCGQKPKALTPRLANILKLLMEHPGEVCTRKQVFGTVWETDYFDDMRSLDVHIRWLREMIEEKPRKPKYLITVRGVGYYLDPYAGKNPDGIIYPINPSADQETQSQAVEANYTEETIS